MEKLEIKTIVEKFNANKIKYLLIGRQAVVLYGLPVTSFDYDFWIWPEDRQKIYKILSDEGFEPSVDIEEKRPIVFFVRDIYKIDTFFAKQFGKLKFEDCHKRAKIFSEKDFSIYIASPEDIIALKKFRSPLQAKDTEDIKFLTKILKEKSGKD